MRRKGLFRLIAVATITAVVGFASPAWAATVPINDAHVPMLAKDFKGGDECTEPLDDLDPNQDGWHFVTTGTDSFTSLTLKFHTPGGDVTVTITGTEGAPSSGTGWEGWLDNAGAAEKHAYLITDAGWELFEGSAEISGNGTFFNLSHTCAGTPSSESPSPSPSTSESESTSPSASTSTDPGLPRTGTKITGIVLSGLGAVAVGGAILLVLRRRRDALLSTPEE